MAVERDGGLDVSKKRDGLLVSGPRGSDFMTLIEGLIYRLTGRIPKRLIEQFGRRLPRKP